MDIEYGLEMMKEVVEGTMFDEITIHRDKELSGDDNWDEETGTYARPEGDDTLVYSGEAYLAPQQTFPRSERVGGQDTLAQWYWVGIPLGSSYVPVAEDRITVVYSKFDPLLAGEELYADAAELSTFSVSRRIRAHRRTEVP